MQIRCSSTLLTSDNGYYSSKRNSMSLPGAVKRLCLIMLALLPGIATAGNGAPVVEPISENVMQRLERIERKLDNQSLLDLYNQVQELQSEVKRLRGELDTQQHRLEEMTQRQKDLHADIDERIQKLEAAEPASREEVDVDLGARPEETEIDTDTAADSTGSDAQTADSSTTDTPADSVTADSADAREVYDNAFKLLKNGEYQQATDAFQQYLNDNPDGDFADNARYWLGEAYYVNRDFDKAISAYQQLLNDYPDSQKAPHAMLKIGYSQQELGNRDQAVKTLQELRDQYPDTTAASLARERLQEIQSAGT